MSDDPCEHGYIVCSICNVPPRPRDYSGDPYQQDLSPLQIAGVVPSGVPSEDIPVKSECEIMPGSTCSAILICEQYESKLEKLTRQLAEAKAALAESEKQIVSADLKLAADAEAAEANGRLHTELQAALDRERAAFKEDTEQAKRVLQQIGEQIDRERAARLRTEAGAAVMRNAAAKYRCLIRSDGPDMQILVAGTELDAALSTDTGARLAAVVSEEMKKPCNRVVTWQLPNCMESIEDKDLWCARCHLVDAMEAKI